MSFRTAPAEHLDILRRDLAYTFRMLARRPVLTFTAVLTLALGIGANTAIFSVVNGVLFAPLDYRHADQLVLVEEQFAGRGPGMTGYPTYADLRNENLTIQSSAALTGLSATLTGEGETPSVSTVRGSRGSISGRSASLLRLAATSSKPRISPGARLVAIISDSLWRRRFGADPNVVGRTDHRQSADLHARGRAAAEYRRHHYLARKFPGAEIWTLLRYSEQMGPPACRGCRHIFVVARLKDGVTRSQAETDLTRIFQSLAMRFPTQCDRPRPAVTPLRDYFLGPVKTPLYCSGERWRCCC